MLAGMPIAEVEQRLSEAASSSLWVPPSQRPLHIAELLLGLQPETELLETMQKPSNLDVEIQALTTLIRNAVNSAARRDGDPLENIAAFLLQLYAEDLEETETEEPEAQQVEAHAATALTQTLKAASASKEVPRPKPPPRSLSALKAILGKPKGQRSGLPVLGRTASSVFPAVVGAFQEETAKRAAKTIDESVIGAAIAAGGEVPSVLKEPKKAKCSGQTW